MRLLAGPWISGVARSARDQRRDRWMPAVLNLDPMFLMIACLIVILEQLI